MKGKSKRQPKQKKKEQHINNKANDARPQHPVGPQDSERTQK
jgi:hypothetical protein